MRAASRVIAVFALLLVLLPGASSAQPTEADVYVSQAIVDFDEGRYDRALESLRRALQIAPNHVEALYYTGVVHMARRHPEEAIPFLERARARAPKNTLVAFQLGLAHFSRQDYAQAQPLLDQAFKADPTLDGLGYYLGFIRYRNRDYRGALSAFRAGRASDPETQQLTRLYGALALAALGLPAQAGAEVEQAIRLAPASAVTGPAERLRDTIVAAREKERRLSVQLRLGGFYDDNVAVIPDRDGGEPLVPLLRDTKHESSGELLGLRLDWVAFREGAFDATVGYSFFGTYNNELPSFNVTDHLSTVGANYRTALGTMPTQLSVQYGFDVLFLDDDEFIRRHTASVVGALVESDLHLTQVFGRYQNKEFNEQPPLPPKREIRDADNWMGGFLHLLRFSQDRHFFKAGYQFDYEDTDGANYAYLGHRILLGAQYTTPWGGTRLGWDFDVHLRDYTNENSILPTTAPGTTEREDREITNIVRVEVPLPASLTLSAEYQNTINRSNLKVFEYKRNVVSLSLVWTY